MWTKTDRVMAVLNGELPDRIPVFEYLINDKILERYSDEKPIKTGDKKNILRSCSNYLDICHPTWEEPYTPGERILEDGTKRVFERWTFWDIPSPDKTQDDLIKQVKKEIETNEAYKTSASEVAEWKKQAALINRWAQDMVYIHIGNSCDIFPGTLEEGIYLFADEPELVRRWSKAKNRRNLAWIEAVADAKDSPVMINWNDIGIKGGLVYPEYILEEFLYPALSELCSLIHSRGMKLIFHSDGDVSKAMDKLIECGIDGLNPIETTAGMSYKAFKETYGKKVAMVGGLDAVEILSFGSVKRVVEETKQFIEIAGKNGGLIAASASGEIDNSMPYENITAYFETIYEYGKY